MKDREILAWIHARLEHVHKENPHADYMHALRAIVLATPPDRCTVTRDGGNNSADMRARIADTEKMG